jgi:hypothetical protein
MRKRLLVCGVILVFITGLLLAIRSLRSQKMEAATSASGQMAGHQMPQKVQMKNVQVSNLFVYFQDPKKRGEITYTLDEPAIVSIKVKDSRTRELFLRTIVDWEKRSAGTHTESWDGRDNAGNILDPARVSVLWTAEAISAYAPGAATDKELLYYENGAGNKGWEGHVHARHAKEAEETPLLRILSPAKGDTLSGLVWIRSEVDKQKRGYGDKFGYGARYYVDQILAKEEFYKPECDGKFAYQLDTTAFEDGEHSLQVGMCDHNEHQTSFAVKVVIKN